MHFKLELALFMDKKILIPLVVAVLIGAILVAAYMLYPGAAPGGQGAGLPKHPAVVGTYQTSSDTSVTIKLQDGGQRTFAVSSTTKVVSQVASAEVGKTLSQFAAGAAVQVQPSNKSRSTADMILLMPAPVATNQDPTGPSVTLSGTLVATTTTSISIRTEQDPSLHIELDAGTVVYSNTLAGHKGASLNDTAAGMYVQVEGSASADGISARSVQLLVPLVQ